MNPFDIAQQFIERCEGAERTNQLMPAFARSLENLGFRHFACASHVDPLNADHDLMVLNYPPSWVACYSEQQFHRIDPVFLRAERSRSPFFWDDPAFRKSMDSRQRHMQRLASEFGIAKGYTVPIHGPLIPHGRCASCSVVPETTSIDKRSYAALQLMAYHLFDTAMRLKQSASPPPPGPKLCRRERECLELAALGKDDDEIAAVLGISRATVHYYIRSTRERLGLSSRVQLVVYAVAAGLISPAAVITPLHRLVTVYRTPH